MCLQVEFVVWCICEVVVGCIGDVVWFGVFYLCVVVGVGQVYYLVFGYVGQQVQFYVCVVYQVQCGQLVYVVLYFVGGLYDVVVVDVVGCYVQGYVVGQQGFYVDFLLFVVFGVEWVICCWVLVGCVLWYEVVGDVGIQVNVVLDGKGVVQMLVECVVIYVVVVYVVFIFEVILVQFGQYVLVCVQCQFILQIVVVVFVVGGGVVLWQGGQVVVMLGVCVIDWVEQVDVVYWVGVVCQVGIVGGLCGEVGVELVYVGVEQYFVFDMVGVDFLYGIVVGGEGFVVVDLVVQLVCYLFGYVVVVMINQFYWFVVYLVFVVVELVCSNVYVQCIEWCEVVLCQCDFGVYVEEVVGFVVVLVLVGQEVVGIVYWYVVQVVVVQVLGDVGELQYQFVGLVNVEGQ